MASGITVADDFADALKNLSMRKTGLIVMKINKDMTMVNVEKTLPPTEDPVKEWKEFIKTLPENDCRYILSDFMMKDTPTVTKSKIVMILWSPEYAPIRSKMIYAASRESVSGKASCVQKNIQATEMDELAYDCMKTQVFK